MLNQKAQTLKTQVSSYHRYRVIALLLAVFVSVGEFAARHWLGLGTPPLYIQHPSIEYMLKPNQDVYRFGHRFIVNQFGMRAEPFLSHKEKKEFRLMVYGDSVLNGGNLTDQADLATSLVRDQLIKRGYKSVTVGNISAGSWGPGNWLAYAKEYGFFDADVVVLVISSHDSSDNPTFKPLDKSTHPTDRPVSALLEGIERYFPRYLLSLEIGNKGAESDSFEERGEHEMKKGIGDLSEFLELARLHAKDVLVLQHLERSEIGNGQPKDGYLKINRLCSQLGVKTVSLGEYYGRAREIGLTPHRDNIHLNEVGQRFLAEAMLENISIFDVRLM